MVLRTLSWVRTFKYLKTDVTSTFSHEQLLNDKVLSSDVVIIKVFRGVFFTRK